VREPGCAIEIELGYQSGNLVQDTQNGAERLIEKAVRVEGVLFEA